MLAASATRLPRNPITQFILFPQVDMLHPCHKSFPISSLDFSEFMWALSLKCRFKACVNCHPMSRSVSANDLCIFLPTSISTYQLFLNLFLDNFLLFFLINACVKLSTRISVCKLKVAIKGNVFTQAIVKVNNRLTSVCEGNRLYKSA